MIWLYRLQQRLAITRNEGVAIVTLAGLLLLGLAVRHIRPHPPVPDPATYTEMEARFRAHVERLPGANRAADEPRRRIEAQGERMERINLNAASNAALQRLPGIGPALSARIEAYRSTHGPFIRVEDLTHVRGIGEKTLARLKPMLYVGEKP